MSIRSLAIALTALLGCGHPTSSGGSAGPSASAPAASSVEVGAQAPDARLTRTSGEKVALADVLHQHAQTVLVFYRGFW
jgi:hypothetical protein